MKINVAAIQMPCEPGRADLNVGRADDLLRQAYLSGADLAVLPEMFNTGYGLIPDYAPLGETLEGPTLSHLRERSRAWKMDIAAGFVERDGRDLYDALAFVSPDGSVHSYRKRHLVFWERFRFRPGSAPLIVPTRFGRVGFAICADMIYREVWRDYRDRIDLAVVSAAWPDFACRHSGRKHWLLGHVGPLSAAIPGKVALDLGVPVVFSNQSGETRTTIPILWEHIADRFAGKSCVCDGRHGTPVSAETEEAVVVAPVTIHHAHRGVKSWRFTSPSAPVV